MKTKTKHFYLVTILFLSTLLFGCGSTASSFYLLTPTNNYQQGDKIVDSNLGIGIGSLDLPDYLRKPQIATYTKNNEIIFDEYNRWAEPLDENITSVLAENLAELIPTNNIYLFMWPKEDPNIFQIGLSVDRFGALTDSTVVLDVRWSVSGSNRKSLLLTKKSSYSQKAKSLNYGQISLIMSKLIGQLSEEIASDIREKASNN